MDIEEIQKVEREKAEAVDEPIREKEEEIPTIWDELEQQILILTAKRKPKW